MDEGTVSDFQREINPYKAVGSKKLHPRLLKDITNVLEGHSVNREIWDDCW